MQTYPATPATYDGHDSEEDYLPDWIDIMVHPRSAIQRIVTTRTLVSAFVLIVLNSLISLPINRTLLATNLGQIHPRLATLPFFVPINVTLGIAGLLTGGVVLSFVGKRFGGDAYPSEVMMAMGWSQIPNLICNALYLVVAFVLGVLLGLGLLSIQAVSAIIVAASFVAAIPGLIVLGLALSGVHHYSAGSAVLTLLLPPLVLGLFFAACTVCVSMSSFGSW